MTNQPIVQSLLLIDEEKFVLVGDPLTTFDGWQCYVALTDGPRLPPVKQTQCTFKLEPEGLELVGSITEITLFSGTLCLTVQRASLTDFPLTTLVPMP